MSLRKRIAILIAYGPEARAFLHSGLAARIQQSHDIVFVTSRPESAVFRPYRGVTAVPAPPAARPELLARTDSLCRRACSFGRLAGSLAGQAQRAANRLIGVDPSWSRLLRSVGADALLTASYNSARTLPAVQAARLLGLPVVVAANSWKDVYAKPYAPVPPDTVGLGSNDEARRFCEANPAARPESVFVSGSLHVAALLDVERGVDRVSFCESEGLDPARPFLCYTAASAKAAPNEEQLVRILLGEIAAGRIEGRPQVLLRLNPMDDGVRFRALAREARDLVLQRPCWEWSPESDWCCALGEDVRRWAATLRNAAANISIASTVTLECAAMGRPVVNVLFGAEAAERMWQADFYGEARRKGWAVAARGAGELAEALNAALSGPRPKPAPELAALNPVERVARAVEAALALSEASSRDALHRFAKRFSQA